MNALAAAVCELMGWADGDSLRARLARAAPEVAAERGLEPARWAFDERFVRQVAERSAVHETYFFRHAEQLAASCAELLRTFPGQTLCAWSAACSTGEEAWSLAMQLLDGGAAPDRLQVLGTDVSPGALSHARAGRYAEWSFRGVPAAVRERCFVSSDDAGRERSSVAERYRRPVQFLAHNLLSPPPLREAHLIACRNALIYLRPDAAQRALRHLDAVLAPGGLLLLGTAEQHLASELGLEPLLLEGNVLVLRKPAPTARSAPREAPPSPAPAPLSSRATPLPQPTLPRVLSSEAPIEAAWRALRAGLEGEARALAEAAAAAQLAEAHLVLATLDETAGEPQLALEHLRRALYLDPRLILAHVSQAALYGRLGRERDAGRARSNALRHLSALEPETILSALTPVSVRELREALEAA